MERMSSLFWRNPPQQQVVMGLLRVLHEQGPPVRILDIGASSGEQITGYAMLLRDEYGSRWRDRFEITCLDPSSARCESFRRGRYRKATLYRMPEVFRERYIGQRQLDNNDDWFQLLDLSLVECIRIVQSRFEDYTDGTCDLVFAQNVLFHMEPAAADACVRRAHGLLRPGGYFVCAGRHPEAASQLEALGFLPVLHDVIRVYESWSLRKTHLDSRFALKPYDPHDAALSYKIGSVFERPPWNFFGHSGQGAIPCHP